jgi:hypothetical protein
MLASEMAPSSRAADIVQLGLCLSRDQHVSNAARGAKTTSETMTPHATSRARRTAMAEAFLDHMLRFGSPPEFLRGRVGQKDVLLRVEVPNDRRAVLRSDRQNSRKPQGAGQLCSFASIPILSRRCRGRQPSAARCRITSL